MSDRYLRSVMSASSHQQLAEVERRLDAASAILTRLDALDAMEAARIGALFDRVASELHRLMPPPDAPRSA
jgi:hypothetical protein